jgi:Large polyvalent protein-associated domain 3
MFEDLIPSPPAEASAPPPGMFADLVPAGGASGAAAGGMLGDLVPQYEPVPDPWLGLKDAKTGIPLVRDIKPGKFIADIAGEDDGGVYWKDPASGTIRWPGPGELVRPEGGKFKVYAREETVRPWTLGDMGLVRAIVSGLTAPRDVLAGDVAPSEVIPRALDFAALATGGTRSTLTTWRPRVKSTPAPTEPPPDGSPEPPLPSQQQIADNRAQIGDSLSDVGIPPDRVDPADIEGAARLVTRRDLLTFGAFKRAVVGDALERGFATPEEIDQAYGPGTADKYRGTSPPATEEAAPAQGPAAPGPDSDAPQSQQLARERIEAALGENGLPPDRVDPADIEGAARFVTRRDVLTLDAFRRAVIGDALERGFATPEEVDQVYGGGTADDYRGTSTPANGEAAPAESPAPIRPDSNAPQGEQLPRPGEDGGATRREPDATPGQGQPAGAAERSSETGSHPPAAADEPVPADEHQPGGPAEPRAPSGADPNNAAGPEEIVRPDGIAPEDEARPPVAARLTGEELGPTADLKDLRDLALQYARENLIGRVVTNHATGFPITINLSGMKKATSGGHNHDLLRMVPAVPDMIEHGHWLGMMPDRFKRKAIRAVHVFHSAVELGGRRFDTIFFVRQTRDGRFFYDYGMKRGDTEMRSGQGR